MITDSFDPLSPAKINPFVNENAEAVDACILTFSHVIEENVLRTYDCGKIGEFYFATGATPVYRLLFGGKKFAFYKTYVGAPACVGTIEDTFSLIRTKKYILFGGSGCLNREIAHGRVMVPTSAYRDEGTSYHYQPASDYIDFPNSTVVQTFMKEYRM